AGRRFAQAEHQAYGRRLARAVRAEHGHDFARPDGEADAAQGLHRAITLARGDKLDDGARVSVHVGVWRTRPSVVWGRRRVNVGLFRLRYNPAMREAARIAAAGPAVARKG